jgi:ATPase family protein associated with various cellular activities (AAA)
MSSRAPDPSAPVVDARGAAAEHFKLWFYAAVVRVLTSAVDRVASWEPLFERFPFLAHYNNELSVSGIGGVEASEAPAHWLRAVAAWEAATASHLPLRALREAAALDADAMALLMTIGLPDEDPRFGEVFDLLQGEIGMKRPTAGLLASWWDGAGGAAPARTHVRRLQELGLIQPLTVTGPRSEWAFQVPASIWEAARGDWYAEPAGGLLHTPPGELALADEVIATPDLHASLARLPVLVAAGECDALIVRGPRHNSRGTIAGALARALGRGLVETRGLDEERWRTLGPLATLLHAMPLLRLDVAPGEAVTVPRLRASDAPLAIVLGRHGGVTGPAVERAITIVSELPDPASRRRHWTAACADTPIDGLDRIAARFRLTAGNIRRAARRARAGARLAGRPAITAADVQEAARALNREALDTLATHVTAPADWSHVAVAPHTARELAELERRCRVRERLGAAVGPALAPQLTCGVRALLSGPSGVGKSMVARALATSLQMDLYVVNIAAILNKYVGETEKNLNELFARAEELDVMLLLDEGDALLTARTSVSSANDRYANFETNFLLQRIESFDGILVITTNAAERIDGAFQRRLDIVIEFTPPEPPERLAIWDAHLPAQHEVPYAMLADVASRCVMTGGQIRNAVLHAGALALEDGGRVTPSHLHAAVEREYRKAGGMCPIGAPVHA